MFSCKKRKTVTEHENGGPSLPLLMCRGMNQQGFERDWAWLRKTITENREIVFRWNTILKIAFGPQGIYINPEPEFFRDFGGESLLLNHFCSGDLGGLVDKKLPLEHIWQFDHGIPGWFPEIIRLSSPKNLNKTQGPPLLPANQHVH